MMRDKIIFWWILTIIILGPANAFASGEIYTAPAVAVGPDYSIWVYWGTGNKTDILSKTGTDRFFAVKDADRTTTYSLSNLTDITSTTFVDDPDKKGWYINMSSGTGEKILASPEVSDKKLYFTSYIPASTTDYCNKAGTSRIYIIHYITGAGYFGGGKKWGDLGGGVSSSVVISRNPYNKKDDVYFSTSEEGAGRYPDPSPNFTPRTNLLYWRDLRIQ